MISSLLLVEVGLVYKYLQVWVLHIQQAAAILLFFTGRGTDSPERNVFQKSHI